MHKSFTQFSKERRGPPRKEKIDLHSVPTTVAEQRRSYGQKLLMNSVQRSAVRSAHVKISKSADVRSVAVTKHLELDLAQLKQEANDLGKLLEKETTLKEILETPSYYVTETDISLMKKYTVEFNDLQEKYKQLLTHAVSSNMTDTDKQTYLQLKLVIEERLRDIINLKLDIDSKFEEHFKTKARNEILKANTQMEELNNITTTNINGKSIINTYIAYINKFIDVATEQCQKNDAKNVKYTLLDMTNIAAEVDIAENSKPPATDQSHVLFIKQHISEFDGLSDTDKLIISENSNAEAMNNVITAIKSRYLTTIPESDITLTKFNTCRTDASVMLQSWNDDNFEFTQNTKSEYKKVHECIQKTMTQCAERISTLSAALLLARDRDDQYVIYNSEPHINDVQSCNPPHFIQSKVITYYQKQQARLASILSKISPGEDDTEITTAVDIYKAAGEYAISHSELSVGDIIRSPDITSLETGDTTVEGDAKITNTLRLMSYDTYLDTYIHASTASQEEQSYYLPVVDFNRLLKNSINDPSAHQVTVAEFDAFQTWTEKYLCVAEDATVTLQHCDEVIKANADLEHARILKNIDTSGYDSNHLINVLNFCKTIKPMKDESQLLIPSKILTELEAQIRKKLKNTMRNEEPFCKTQSQVDELSSRVDKILKTRIAVIYSRYTPEEILDLTHTSVGKVKHVLENMLTKLQATTVGTESCIHMFDEVHIPDNNDLARLDKMFPGSGERTSDFNHTQEQVIGLYHVAQQRLTEITDLIQNFGTSPSLAALAVVGNEKTRVNNIHAELARLMRSTIGANFNVARIPSESQVQGLKEYLVHNVVPTASITTDRYFSGIYITELAKLDGLLMMYSSVPELKDEIASAILLRKELTDIYSQIFDKPDEHIIAAHQDLIMYLTSSFGITSIGNSMATKAATFGYNVSNIKQTPLDRDQLVLQETGITNLYQNLGNIVKTLGGVSGIDVVLTTILYYLEKIQSELATTKTSFDFDNHISDFVQKWSSYINEQLLPQIDIAKNFIQPRIDMVDEVLYQPGLTSEHKDELQTLRTKLENDMTYYKGGSVTMETWHPIKSIHELETVLQTFQNTDPLLNTILSVSDIDDATLDTILTHVPWLEGKISASKTSADYEYQITLYNTSPAAVKMIQILSHTDKNIANYMLYRYRMSTSKIVTVPLISQIKVDGSEYWKTDMRDEIAKFTFLNNHIDDVGYNISTHDSFMSEFSSIETVIDQFVLAPEDKKYTLAKTLAWANNDFDSYFSDQKKIDLEAAVTTIELALRNVVTDHNLLNTYKDFANSIVDSITTIPTIDNVKDGLDSAEMKNVENDVQQAILAYSIVTKNLNLYNTYHQRWTSIKPIHTEWKNFPSISPASDLDWFTSFFQKQDGYLHSWDVSINSQYIALLLATLHIDVVKEMLVSTNWESKLLPLISTFWTTINASVELQNIESNIIRNYFISTCYGHITSQKCVEIRDFYLTSLQYSELISQNPGVPASCSAAQVKIACELKKLTPVLDTTLADNIFARKQSMKLLHEDIRKVLNIRPVDQQVINMIRQSIIDMKVAWKKLISIPVNLWGKTGKIDTTVQTDEKKIPFFKMWDEFEECLKSLQQLFTMCNEKAIVYKQFFQDIMMENRCEKIRQMLNTTDLPEIFNSYDIDKIGQRLRITDYSSYMNIQKMRSSRNPPVADLLLNTLGNNRQNIAAEEEDEEESDGDYD